jgi:hypothetical protein
LWAVVAYDRHYLMLQDHWGCSMLVGTSEI